LFREVEIAWRTYLPQHLNATMGLSLAATGWIRDRVEPRHGRRKPIQHHAEAGHGVGASGNLWLISLSGFDTQSLFLPTGARLAVGIYAGPIAIAAAVALMILIPRRRTGRIMAVSVT
jgi:hypothetical protein